MGAIDVQNATTPRRANLASIRMAASGLPPSENAVARFVLEQPEQVLALGIDALSRKSRVSTASVTRFCQRLGFRGYKDFKISFASELGHAVVVLPEALEPKDSPMSIARKVFKADVRAIEETLEMLDEVTFARSIAYLDSAEAIQIYGVGSSAPVAEDAYYRFLRIGLPVSVVTDTHIQAVSASLLRPGKVAFAISHTGRTSATLAAANYAKEAGATVVGLTSFQNAPLVAVADACIVTATGESAFRVEAMASRIAHLSVVDALYVALALRRSDEALRVLDMTNRVIEANRA